MNKQIAVINITTTEFELMEQVKIDEETWDSPLSRSLVWMQIEEAVDRIRKHRQPLSDTPSWTDGLRKSIKEDKD